MDDGLDPSDPVASEREMRRLLRWLIDRVGTIEDSVQVSDGGYELLGFMRLEDTPGDTMSVVNLEYRRFLRVVVSSVPDGAVTSVIRFNGDSGSNYAYSTVTNGATFANQTTRTYIVADIDGTTTRKFCVLDIINSVGGIKLVNGFANSEAASGVSTATSIRTLTGKWEEPDEVINRIDITNILGVYGVGSEVRVYGSGEGG